MESKEKIKFLDNVQTNFDIGQLDIYLEKLNEETLGHEILRLLILKLSFYDFNKNDTSIENNNVSNVILDYKKIFNSFKMHLITLNPKTFFKFMEPIIVKRTVNLQFLIFEYYRNCNKEFKKEMLNIMLSKIYKLEYHACALFCGFIIRNKFVEYDFGVDFIIKCIKTYGQIILAKLNGINFSFYLYMRIYFNDIYTCDEIDEQLINKAYKLKNNDFKIHENILLKWIEITGDTLQLEKYDESDLYLYFMFDINNDMCVYELISDMYRIYQ